MRLRGSIRQVRGPQGGQRGLVQLARRVASRIEQVLAGSDATTMLGSVGKEIWFVVVSPATTKPGMIEAWQRWLEGGCGDGKPEGEVVVRLRFYLETGKITVEAAGPLFERIKEIMAEFSEIGPGSPSPINLN